MTVESALLQEPASTPDWLAIFDRARRYVRREHPELASMADDLAQTVTTQVQRQFEAGELRLEHGRASLLAYVNTSTRNACNALSKQLRRQPSEALEDDLPAGEDDYAWVELLPILDRCARLPVECPLCAWRSQPCGRDDQDAMTVRAVARAACLNLAFTGSRAALGRGQVDGFLRRVGAEAGILAPETVDKSTTAGTRFTRSLSVCTAHLVFRALLPIRAHPAIVIDAAASARQRCGCDWGERREAAIAAWADDWSQPWERR